MVGSKAVLTVRRVLFGFLLAHSVWGASVFSAVDVNTVTNRRVGPGDQGSGVTRAQILLDRAHFSPGEITGQYNDNLRVAILGYQSANRLQPSGVVEGLMWQMLNRDFETPLMVYVLRIEDVRGPFVRAPKDAVRMAGMDWLGFDSPQQELGEMFHISPRLLAELNPGVNFHKAGERIQVPRVQRNVQLVASRIVVSRGNGTVTSIGPSGRPIAQYPATIGSRQDPFTPGQFEVSAVEFSPVFYYNPTRFWNGTSLDAAARIAPGPKNPAGTVWIGISKLHYGFHGTPWPERVGMAEDKGCIRMTNWDAMELSGSVYRGMTVELRD